MTFVTPALDQPQIRAVITDYGQVLCHLPSAAHIDRFARIFHVDSESFLPIYLRSRAAYDRGDLLPAEYWDSFAAQVGIKLDPQTLGDIRRLDVEMWCRQNEPMIRWVEEIHSAGFKTAIMSNMPLDLVEYLRANAAWINQFDQKIFSAEVRSVKPERAIYQHAIDILEVEPLQALFIDDREENLDQARAVGIRAVRYQSVSQVREDLRALGFTILPW